MLQAKSPVVGDSPLSRTRNTTMGPKKSGWAALYEKSYVEALHRENWRQQFVTSKDVHRGYL